MQPPVQTRHGPSALEVLSEGLVHLWFARPEELHHHYDQFLSFLSVDEHTRASTYRLEAPRVQFVLARGWLRRTLALYIGASPQSLQFGTTGNGKPVLVGHGQLNFNLSHTAGAIALALASDRAVGIDVEKVQARRSLEAIAQQQFHPDERADFESSSEASKLAAFYRIWTCKEAYLKGLGLGFAQPLTSFAMRRKGERYRATPGLDDNDWSLISEIRTLTRRDDSTERSEENLSSQAPVEQCALAIAAPGQWQLHQFT